jgi:hypothetical protein
MVTKKLSNDSIKIIDKCNRDVLIEGRDNGMAFSFLQKTGKNEFTTVQPPSPCKDYLAEVVFTEKYDIPTRGCGLYYKQKLNIFSDCAYMAIKILKAKGGGYSYGKSFEHDVEMLKDNHKNIERLMNQYEKKIGLKVLTKIEEANDDFFLVKFSSEWCKSTHSISLYSLLLRVLMASTEKDKDFMSVLKNYNYHNGDKSLLTSSLPKIELIMKEKKLPPNVRKYSKANMLKFRGSPHDNGILNWDKTFVEVPLGA